MTAIVRAITFDCGDAAELAEFWSRALDAPIALGPSAGFASLSLSADGPSLLFIEVPEGKTTKNRVHLDLTAPDLDAEVERLVSLGARKEREVSEGRHRWVTLTDPEGNEFDLFAD
ncbi:VOC family protein [Nonomuraea sp. NPDC003707]